MQIILEIETRTVLRVLLWMDRQMEEELERHTLYRLFRLDSLQRAT